MKCIGKLNAALHRNGFFGKFGKLKNKFMGPQKKNSGKNRRGGQSGTYMIDKFAYTTHVLVASVSNMLRKKQTFDVGIRTRA